MQTNKTARNNKSSFCKRMPFSFIKCMGSRKIFEGKFKQEQLYVKTAPKNHIFLTIDDYPSENPENSYELLKLLDRLGITATFFVTGKQVQMRSENLKVLKDTVKRGHRLANHLMLDKDYSKGDLEEFKRDLISTEKILSEADPEFGKRLPKLFRPPQAGMNNQMQKDFNAKDYLCVLADVYSFDYQYDMDVTFHCDFIRTNVKTGSIIVLHTPEDQKHYKTIAILEKVVPDLKKKDFVFDDLSKYYHSETFQSEWKQISTRIQNLK